MNQQRSVLAGGFFAWLEVAGLLYLLELVV